MANRTVLVDNNTWNNSHIAQVGKAMASREEDAVAILRQLDVDYILVIFGGLTGYASDGTSIPLSLFLLLTPSLASFSSFSLFSSSICVFLSSQFHFSFINEYIIRYQQVFVDGEDCRINR